MLNPSHIRTKLNKFRFQATILLTHDHASLGKDGSENAALQESQVRMMLQGLKRCRSLKHYMLIVGLNAKALRRQRSMVFEEKGKGNGRQSPFEAKGPSKAKALRRRRQKPYEGKGKLRPFEGKHKGNSTGKAKTLRRKRLKAARSQIVNYTFAPFSTKTNTHPPYSRSLESWYGWVGGCCINRVSRSEHVAAVKAVVSFEALYVERWLQGKGTSKAKALGRNQPLEGKGESPSKAKALGMQKPFEDEGIGSSKATVL